MGALDFRRRRARRNQEFRPDDPIDPARAGLLGCEVLLQLLLHDAGQETPHRMRLPTGRTRHRGNRGTVPSMEHAQNSVVLGLSAADSRNGTAVSLRLSFGSFCWFWA